MKSGFNQKHALSVFPIVWSLNVLYLGKVLGL